MNSKPVCSTCPVWNITSDQRIMGLSLIWVMWVFSALTGCYPELGVLQPQWESWDHSRVWSTPWIHLWGCCSNYLTNTTGVTVSQMVNSRTHGSKHGIQPSLKVSFSSPFIIKLVSVSVVLHALLCGDLGVNLSLPLLDWCSSYLSLQCQTPSREIHGITAMFCWPQGIPVP